MNVLDIQYKIKLDKAKSKPNNIEEINRLSSEILNDVKDDGAERYRFWSKQLRKLHPLVEYYLSGQKASAPISDVTGEHILNLTADTQTVDLKYFYEEIKNISGETKENTIIPIPIRNSIRGKIPDSQLKMCEESYIQLNQAYSIIMSTFFNDPNSAQGGDPNTWTITRSIAHDFYNTQDYLGFGVKLFLYDSQYKTLVKKYEQKLQLLDNVTPVTERILIDYGPLVLTVEGKQMAIDNFGNKIVRMPETIDESILNPTALNTN